MADEKSGALQDKFLAYCRFGNASNPGDMDSFIFTKMCKECGIIDGKSCTGTDVDLIFTKVKAKGLRRIEFRAFMAALDNLAAKRFPKTYKDEGAEKAVSKIVDLVVNSTGPQANATKADYVKFHDDKSTYTGVYARGGPTNVDGTITLSNLLDRTPADSRGRKVDLSPGRKNLNVSGPNSGRGASLSPSPSKPRAASPGLSSSSSAPRARSKSPQPAASSSSSSAAPSKSPNGQHRSIFDKLTDPTLYTGAHKLRFDPNTGKGRGMAGRDAASGQSYDGSSGVGDLSQITRSNLRGKGQ